MKKLLRPAIPLLGLLTVAGALAGCASAKPVGQALLTPLTVTRDVVDAPLVSITNVFEFFAQQTRPALAPSVGIGASLNGVSPYAGYDTSFFVFKGISLLLGSIDYVVGRSIWPNYPNGLSPWRARDQRWENLYFPSTRVLWGDDGPIYIPPPPPAAPARGPAAQPRGAAQQRMIDPNLCGAGWQCSIISPSSTK